MSKYVFIIIIFYTYTQHWKSVIRYALNMIYHTIHNEIFPETFSDGQLSDILKFVAHFSMNTYAI